MTQLTLLLLSTDWRLLRLTESLFSLTKDRDLILILSTELLSLLDEPNQTNTN